MPTAPHPVPADSPPLVAWLRSLFRSRRFLFRPAERVFEEIWSTGHWARANPGGSRSGPGSSPEVAAPMARELAALLARRRIRRLVDIPCGDFGWMNDLPLDGLDYVGGDIVAPLVEENRRRYGRDGVRFVRLDIRHDPLPDGDLLLVRDLLVHFSFRDARLALDNARRSGIPWLLASTFPDHRRNADAVTGDWRPLNLELPPFSLPPPVESIPDLPDPSGRTVGKRLALWPVAELGGGEPRGR